MKIKTLNRDVIEREIGYRPFTTFYEDFSIADNFDSAAIKDTFNKAFNQWKNDYKYLTELVMILNWKIWEHYESNNEYANLYTKFYEKSRDYALENLSGDELKYFIKTTD